jgi:hypothetical protein
MNQCDGCRRGLPLKDRIHRGTDPWDAIGCTSHLYKEKYVISKDTQQLLFFLLGQEQGRAVGQFRNKEITKAQYDATCKSCHKATTELIKNKE